MLTCSLLCQTGFWSRRADNSGDSAVAVLHQGCGHARRCAMTVASLDVQKTAEGRGRRGLAPRCSATQLGA